MFRLLKKIQYSILKVNNVRYINYSPNENFEMINNTYEIATDYQIEDFLLDAKWKSELKDEFNREYFKHINAVITQGYQKNILKPEKELVFNAFNLTQLENIKVVIIGQDPYHGDDQADGLAFSVKKGIRIPPSLSNIFKELKQDIPGYNCDFKLDGNLENWANNGIFLLNSFLTVEANKPGSHKKIGWDTFTNRVVEIISKKNNGCVFLLWGAFSQKKLNLINTKKHHVIQCAHPSPYSVNSGFFGSKCFSKANEYLVSIGKTPVDWSIQQNELNKNKKLKKYLKNKI